MLKHILKELEATGIAFEPTAWATAPGTDYGAVALDGAGASVWADDRMQEQALEGTVDLFTRDEGHPQMKAVQAALDRSGVSWRLNSIQYEENTGLMHYEWVFELEAD